MIIVHPAEQYSLHKQYIESSPHHLTGHLSFCQDCNDISNSCDLSINLIMK